MTTGRLLMTVPIMIRGSWNRYSYTRGDPVNRFDSRGTDDCDVDDPTCSKEGAPNLETGEVTGEGGGAEGVDPGPSSDDPVFTATGTGCIQQGLTYTGGPDGTCDLPLYGPYISNLQQVGQNANGIYQMVGVVAGGSVLAGTVGGVVAGYLGSTLTTLGLAGTAAAGAAASPQGQEAGETIVEVGTTVYRVFGGTSPQFGPSWTPVDPTTVANYPNAAGLPPGNTAQWMVTGTRSGW
jgi:hypothetical protein